MNMIETDTIQIIIYLPKRKNKIVTLTITQDQIKRSFWQHYVKWQFIISIAGNVAL